MSPFCDSIILVGVELDVILGPRLRVVYLFSKLPTRRLLRPFRDRGLCRLINHGHELLH